MSDYVDCWFIGGPLGNKVRALPRYVVASRRPWIVFDPGKAMPIALTWDVLLTLEDAAMNPPSSISSRVPA